MPGSCAVAAVHELKVRRIKNFELRQSGLLLVRLLGHFAEHHEITLSTNARNRVCSSNAKFI